MSTALLHCTTTMLIYLWWAGIGVLACVSFIRFMYYLCVCLHIAFSLSCVSSPFIHICKINNDNVSFLFCDINWLLKDWEPSSVCIDGVPWYCTQLSYSCKMTHQPIRAINKLWLTVTHHTKRDHSYLTLYVQYRYRIKCIWTSEDWRASRESGSREAAGAYLRFGIPPVPSFPWTFPFLPSPHGSGTARTVHTVRVRYGYGPWRLTLTYCM